MKCFNSLVCLNGKKFMARFLLYFSRAFRSKFYKLFLYWLCREQNQYLFKFQIFDTTSDFLLMLLVYERGVLKSLPLTMDLSFWFCHFLLYTF